MYLAAKLGKGRFVWRVWEPNFEMADRPWTLVDLRLHWGKRTREWRVIVEWEGKWPDWDNCNLQFYRVINDKREGWALQGPVRKLY